MVGKYCLDVSLDHLRYYAEELADQVYSRPAALLPLVYSYIISLFFAHRPYLTLAKMILAYAV